MAANGSMLDSMMEARPERATNLELVPGGQGRLSTGEVILTIAQLGTQIQSAGGAYQKLPDASPKQVNDILADLIQTAENIKAKASKLLAANR